MPNRSAAICALAVLLALAAPRSGHAASDAGAVVSFNGECYVVAGDQRTLLKVGDTLHVGDLVEVPEAARLRLSMQDGSVLSMGSGSRMTIQSFTVNAAGERLEARLQLASGLFRAVVGKPPQPAIFEVDTPTGAAAAKGTDWFVEADPGTTRVSVLDGAVAFAKPGASLAANASVTIPAMSESGSSAQAAPAPAQHETKAQFAQLKERTQVRYGWCQCISDMTVIRADCETSPGGCKAGCAGGNYSFVPDARLSCAKFYADPVPGPGRKQ